jgi:hypothetical protein
VARCGNYRLQSLLRSRKSEEWLVLDHDFGCSRPTLFLGLAYDQRDDLAVIKRLLISEQDFIMADGADII